MVIPFQQNIKMITKQCITEELFALRLNSCRAQGSADDRGTRVVTLTSRPGRAIGTYIIKTESKLYFIIK